MAELRTDWLTGRSVIIAEDRANRPNQFRGATAPVAPGDGGLPAATCPFCAGQEVQTPPAVYEHPPDGAGPWRVRVVPNKYPALAPGAEQGAWDLRPPNESGSDTGDDTESRCDVAPSRQPAIGIHEVVVESPRHVARMSTLSQAELRDVLEVYIQRLGHWRAGGRYGYGLVFKNEGPRAGASLEHLHSQLVALPRVPRPVREEHQRAARDYRLHGSCPWCRLVDAERREEERVVFAGGGLVALCPAASLQPYEVWLLPESHEPSFEWPDEPDRLDRLAAALSELVARVERILPDAGYNLLWRTAPWTGEAAPWCHWRLELLPRSVTLAGLEFATGIHINPVSPERAAARLREG